MIVYLEDGTEIGLLKEVKEKYSKIDYNETKYIIAVPREVKGKEYFVCYHTQNTFDADMKYVGVAKEGKDGQITIVKPSSSKK